MITATTEVFQAQCDQFDDSVTGYYGTEHEALAAFDSENVFSEAELKRVQPYATLIEVDADDEDAMKELLWFAWQLAGQGKPSPGLGIAARI